MIQEKKTRVLAKIKTEALQKLRNALQSLVEKFMHHRYAVCLEGVTELLDGTPKGLT
jgi:hypothetical protein